MERGADDVFRVEAVNELVVVRKQGNEGAECQVGEFDGVPKGGALDVMPESTHMMAYIWVSPVFLGT